MSQNELLYELCTHTCTKLHFLVPKSNQTIVKDFHFEQNEPNSLCRDKIHLRQYQTITKNSRCTKIQKQYQTKVGFLKPKSTKSNIILSGLQYQTNITQDIMQNVIKG